MNVSATIVGKVLPVISERILVNALIAVLLHVSSSLNHSINSIACESFLNYLYGSFFVV